MKRYMSLVALLVIAGCTVDRQMTATGGSRADGIVELSYDVGEFQGANIDWGSAQSEADQRCQSWGYKSAQKFGGERRRCEQRLGALVNCARFRVTVRYQCLSDGARESAITAPAE